jgi:hypothetical protein
MRKLVLAALVLLVGCDLIKKKGDADAAADAAAEAAAPPAAAVEDAAPPAPAAVNAKNVNDVARFPGETAVTDDDSKLGQPAAARTSPKGGNVVATIKPGADVTKVAEYQGSFLVTFADPKDANTTLIGWIGKDAFTAKTVTTRDGGVDAGAKADAGTHADAGPPSNVKITCPGGSVAVVLAGGPVCKKKCTKDGDCKTTSAGSCANASSPAGSVVRACVHD